MAQRRGVGAESRGSYLERPGNFVPIPGNSSESDRKIARKRRCLQPARALALRPKQEANKRDHRAAAPIEQNNASSNTYLSLFKLLKASIQAQSDVDRCLTATVQLSSRRAWTKDLALMLARGSSRRLNQSCLLFLPGRPWNVEQVMLHAQYPPRRNGTSIYCYYY